MFMIKSLFILPILKSRLDFLCIYRGPNKVKSGQRRIKSKEYKPKQNEPKRPNISVKTTTKFNPVIISNKNWEKNAKYILFPRKRENLKVIPLEKDSNIRSMHYVHSGSGLSMVLI